MKSYALRSFASIFVSLVVVWILIIADTQHASTIPTCPAPLGKEFPLEIQRATQTFQKSCLGSQQDFIESAIEVAKLGEELRAKMVQNVGVSDLAKAYSKYALAFSHEERVYDGLGVFLDKVFIQYISWLTKLSREGEKVTSELLKKYTAWQEAAMAAFRVPNNSRELLNAGSKALNDKVVEEFQKPRQNQVK